MPATLPSNISRPVPVEVGNTGTGTQSLTSMRRDCHSDLVHTMGHVKMLRAHATRLTSRVKRPANAPMVANDVSAAATVHRESGLLDE
jgi:hypothetical protein